MKKKNSKIRKRVWHGVPSTFNRQDNYERSTNILNNNTNRNQKIYKTKTKRNAQTHPSAIVFIVIIKISLMEVDRTPHCCLCIYDVLWMRRVSLFVHRLCAQTAQNIDKKKQKQKNLIIIVKIPMALLASHTKFVIIYTEFRLDARCVSWRLECVR